LSEGRQCVVPRAAGARRVQLAVFEQQRQFVHWVKKGAAYYVAHEGNDGDPGSLSAPVLILDRAKSAMEGSATKATCLRAGNYRATATLALTSPADAETWQYHSPDGVKSAVLDGSNTVAGGVIGLEGTSDVTINAIENQDLRLRHSWQRRSA
jgi:hypothetical protein